MFVLAWMIWNVVLTVFWIVFLAWKQDEVGGDLKYLIQVY